MKTLALAASVLATSVLAAAPAAASATHPVVPARVQARIAKKVPALAYVPTRMALGFRYASWNGTTKAVRVHFRNKAHWDILFMARPQTGACSNGMQKSFQMAGNKVWWHSTATGQEAWRCVSGPSHQLVRLSAFTTKPPTKFADAGLGSIVASGKRIR